MSIQRSVYSNKLRGALISRGQRHPLKPTIPHLGLLADVTARLRAVLASGIVQLDEVLGAVVLDVLVLSALGEQVAAGAITRGVGGVGSEDEREAKGQEERGLHD